MYRWWRSRRARTRCSLQKECRIWAATISISCWRNWRSAKQALSKLELAEVFRLDEECRRQKEALHPNSRKIVVDLDDVVKEGLGQATVSVADFYERCRPLLGRID